MKMQLRWLISGEHRQTWRPVCWSADSSLMWRPDDLHVDLVTEIWPLRMDFTSRCESLLYTESFSCVYLLLLFSWRGQFSSRKYRSCLNILLWFKSSSWVCFLYIAAWHACETKDAQERKIGLIFLIHLFH